MPETDPPELTDRVEALETGQDKLSGKLDEILGLISGSHAKAQEHTEARLDRPSSYEEQVRLELERKDKEAAAAKAKEQEQKKQETVDQRLAKLEETPPVQPQPRRQRWMWGKRT